MLWCELLRILCVIGAGLLAVATLLAARELAARRRAEAELERLRTVERRQRESTALARREFDRLQALLAAMSVGVLFEDREHRVEYVNPAFLRLWAIEPDFGPIGRQIREIAEHSLHRLDRPEQDGGRLFDPGTTPGRLELKFRDGRIVARSFRIVTDAQGRTTGRMWLCEDVTDRRQLLHLAERDPLTGLYNRYRFREHLERSITAASRNGTSFALIYFDLDAFKTVNDRFGHEAGDTVLKRIASEISALIRGGEMLARLGGDEFAILCAPGAGDDPFGLPARIVGALSAIPFRFHETDVRMTASVGIALFPEHGAHAEELLAHADAAMYRAKARGKNTWSL